MAMAWPTMLLLGFGNLSGIWAVGFGRGRRSSSLRPARTRVRQEGMRRLSERTGTRTSSGEPRRRSWVYGIPSTGFTLLVSRTCNSRGTSRRQRHSEGPTEG